MAKTRVGITPYADLQVKALRGLVADQYEEFHIDLGAHGCEALDYRLTGSIIEHICSRHLRDLYRVLVCFRAEDDAVILLVGEHDERDPNRNLYALLYQILDLPIPKGQRKKPPCCDEEGVPPVDPELFDRFEAGLKELGRLRQASLARRRRSSRRR